MKIYWDISFSKHVEKMKIYEFNYLRVSLKYRLEIQKICIQSNYPSPQPSLIQFVG